MLLRSALLDGHGIGLSPTFIVGEDLKAGRLVTLLPEYELDPAAIHVVYPARRYLPPKVRSFVDFLADAFSGTPPWDMYRNAAMTG